jgi:hypothetical protein
VPWKGVFFDGQRLLAGKDTVPVTVSPFGDVFERREFQQWILVNIPPENRITPGQLTWRSVKAAGLAGAIVIALAIVFLAWMVLAPYLRSL